MITMGTDDGPQCHECHTRLWVYRLWPGITSYAVATCASCHAEATVEWPTSSLAPADIVAMRTLHADSVRRGFAATVRTVRNV